MLVLGIGLFYILIGCLGFMSGLLSLPAHAPVLTIDVGYGYLLGLFPVNIVSNIFHLLIGIYFTALCFRWVNVSTAFHVSNFMALLAIFGLIPVINSMFGLIPLFGHNIWLYFLTALIARLPLWWGWRSGEIT
jgi:hypothetical protein